MNKITAAKNYASSIKGPCIYKEALDFVIELVESSRKTPLGKYETYLAQKVIKDMAKDKSLCLEVLESINHCVIVISINGLVSLQ